jgi:hypothetical protein
MICSHCGHPLDERSILEWLSNGVESLSETIRAAHKDCEYSSTQDLLGEGLEDHWLPLDHLPLFLDIALEMKWDSAALAIENFYIYLQQLKEVQNENNRA